MYNDRGGNLAEAALVGAGMGAKELLTAEARAAVEQADALIGAERILKSCGASRKPCFAEYRTEKILDLIREHSEYRRWAVLLSGDIGFYSGAKKLRQALEEKGISCTGIPGIASVVCLAARLGVSWEDAALRSIHGRRQHVIHTIARHAKTFLLLDGRSAGEFCEQLRDYNLGHVICRIGRELSYPGEQILTRTGAEVCPEDFGDLATVLVENPEPTDPLRTHLKDEELIRGSGGRVVPMTKEEVRAVSLAKLALKSDSVLYDIGAGTGSVSIEAALSGESVRVYAVERRPEACRLIGQNRRKFCTDQVEIIQGTAPEALRELETPTHAFIGGSGGHLKETLRCLKEKNPRIRLVITAISLETLGGVTEAVREGLLREPEIIQLQVSKARQLGDYHMMTGQNPIYIITEGQEA